MGNKNSNRLAEPSNVQQHGRRTLETTLETIGENHEVEYCYDSTTLWNRHIRCRKNPGHSKFIPVTEFGAGHLPTGCRDKRFVSYFKTVSKFTVRILVRYTSTDRPSYYPCAKVRGTDLLRVASGTAWLSGEISEFPCPIPDCPYKKEKHNVYGNIRILTSKHVVYDSSEALKTKVQFFYDSSRQSGPGFVTECIGLDYSLEDSDIAHLQCVTHDADLCRILQEHKEEATRIYRNIPPDVWQACKDLCVVIGHPHGLPKVISVGKHVHFEETVTRSHVHYHTGPTCPGSSGSPVYYVCLREKGCTYAWMPAIHSFHCLVTEMNCAFR